MPLLTLQLLILLLPLRTECHNGTTAAGELCCRSHGACCGNHGQVGVTQCGITKHLPGQQARQDNRRHMGQHSAWTGTALLKRRCSGCAGSGVCCLATHCIGSDLLCVLSIAGGSAHNYCMAFQVTMGATTAKRVLLVLHKRLNSSSCDQLAVSHVHLRRSKFLFMSCASAAVSPCKRADLHHAHNQQVGRSWYIWGADAPAAIVCRCSGKIVCCTWSRHNDSLLVLVK